MSAKDTILAGLVALVGILEFMWGDEAKKVVIVGACLLVAAVLALKKE